MPAGQLLLFTLSILWRNPLRLARAPIIIGITPLLTVPELILGTWWACQSITSAPFLPRSAGSTLRSFCPHPLPHTLHLSELSLFLSLQLALLQIITLQWSPQCLHPHLPHQVRGGEKRWSAAVLSQYWPISSFFTNHNSSIFTPFCAYLFIKKRDIKCCSKTLMAIYMSVWI